MTTTTRTYPFNLRLYAYARGNLAVYIGPYRMEGEESPELLKEIGEYLKGERRTFSFEPDFSVYSPKVREVLEYVYSSLPYGKTATYSEIAERLNTHHRAVGFALSRNRHLLLIPCHRVVGKRGLGGFLLGLDFKRFLLSLEGALRGP